MYDYIKGSVDTLTPTEAIVECYGIGYDILISLQTYEAIQNQKDVKIYLHHHLREDEEQFYGFATRDERELFRLLISVSGIGVGTARMMLSSLNDEEIRNAILSEDVATIKSVKGIGLKTAQRLVLELKDKIVKGAGADSPVIHAGADSAVIEEATIALTMLGFQKSNVYKVLPGIIKANPEAIVEDIIKAALQKL